ncbi:MAG: signal peptidase I [Armatimonadota bacterium]
MTGLMERAANLKIEYIIAAIIVLFIARLILGRYKHPKVKAAAEIVESGLIAIVLVFLIIRPFIIQAFYIPSESMEPTLLIKDRILVNKFIYRFREPKHGDIIVFKSPPAANEARADFGEVMMAQNIDRESALFNWNEVVGRVTEVVGDKGELKIHPVSSHGGEFGDIQELCVIGKKDSSGMVLPIEKKSYSANNFDLEVKFAGIDDSSEAQSLVGKEVRIGEKDYIKRVVGLPGDTLEVRPVGVDEYGANKYAVFRNGKELNESYILDSPDYAMPKRKIPDGMLFVMGDNRRNSNDSHRWGNLDRRRVVGKAQVIFYPFNRIRLIR